METKATRDLAPAPFTPFTPMNKDRRNFARLPLRARASIGRDDQIMEASVKNLSIKGALVTVAGRLEIDDVVAFTILHPIAPRIVCCLKARVVRISDQGIGLQFDKTLLD